uniref:Uncharacterized protein n=1 Tax=Arundo donax TaxID=35708 RepID=A0A0A9GTU0_ARUDO
MTTKLNPPIPPPPRTRTRGSLPYRPYEFNDLLVTTTPYCYTLPPVKTPSRCIIS